MPGFFDDEDEEEEETLPETNYFVFFSQLDRQSARVTTSSELPPRYDTWMTGARIPVELPQPLVYEIEPEDEGKLRPYIEEPGAPLMSMELLDALRKAGVDNLDTYDALVREVRTGREFIEYKAVNIIGLVNAADMEQSEYTRSGLGDESDLIDLWFEKLVLDESKLKGQLFFRLAENVGVVLAHRKVVDAVNAANITGSEYIGFAHPAERSG